MALDLAKPAHELTAADLQMHPVWRYLADDEVPAGGDESWVGAVPSAPGPGDDGCYLIGSQFTLGSGEVLAGVVQVTILGRDVLLQPDTIHVQGKSVDVHAPDLAQRLQRLLKRPDARPTHWALAVPLRGETHVRAGRIARSRWWRAAQLLVTLIRLRRLRRQR